MSENVRIDSVSKRADKGVRGGGRGQVDLRERTSRLAQRIWEAFSRHRWATAKVALPLWEAVDEAQRADIVSLAAEALRGTAEVS